jgi:RND family efflux transporter MFP subunit
MNTKNCPLFAWSGVLALGGATLLSIGCRTKSPPVAEVVRPVKTIVVAAGADTRLRSFPGTVEAARRVELAFRVPGLLAKLPVKEGQKVAKGELIAQLRQDEFVARLATLEAELDQARASLRALRAGERPEEIRRREAVVRAARVRLTNSRAEYARNKTLVDRNAVSRLDYERSQTAYLVAQEEYTSAQESLEQATVGRMEDIEAVEAQVRGLEGRVVESQIQLNDSTVRAPYDGVIAQRFVDEGQNITVNDRVVQFQDIEEIDIAVDVPETVMAAEIGLADILDLTAEISAAPGVRFPVRIREIAQVADPVTQTFNIRVAMEAPPNIRVLPGMSASVTLAYRRASVLGERLMIPVEAVAKTAEGEQVAWILGQNNTVTPKAIKLGSASGGRVEVLEGLAPGERIVIAGVRFLRAGMEVRDLGDALGEQS